MSTTTTSITTCDMRGAVIDLSDGQAHRNSIICNDYAYVPVHVHNPSCEPGLRTAFDYDWIDLCPACADRATAIHCEVIPTDGGRSCRHEYSWREGRRVTCYRRSR